jgi:hypothetical protein
VSSRAVPRGRKGETEAAISFGVAGGEPDLRCDVQLLHRGPCSAQDLLDALPVLLPSMRQGLERMVAAERRRANGASREK